MRAKRAILVGGVLVAAAAGAVVLFKSRATPQNAALAARQEAMETLGHCIAKLRPGCKVLVLSNPFTPRLRFS
ncbi:MAG: hypothetical protein AB9869_11910 [Verrucomicrobiia bacterium]